MSAERTDRDTRLDDLLGAYALHALDAEEQTEIEQYLAANDGARREVARYEDVLAALASADVEEPPAILWERVRSNLTPRAPMIDLTAARSQRRRRRAPLLAVAAALLLVVAVVGVGIGLGRDGDGTTLTELAQRAQDAPGSRVGVLQGSAGEAPTVIGADGEGYLIADGLRDLDDAQTYQLWSLDGDVPVSLGVMEGEGTVMRFAGRDTHTLALSIEPVGGSALPTMPPAAMGTV